MSQATLKTVALETLANNTKTAEQAVLAYRVNTRRLVEALDSRVAQPAADRVEPYAPQLAEALRRSSRQAGEWTVKGIEAVSDRGDALITAGSARVAAQVRYLARVAGDVQQPLLVRGLDAAARVSLPGAQVALAVSERVLAAADKLPVEAPVVAKATKAVKAGARSVSKVATQATDKVGKVVKAAEQATKAPRSRKSSPDLAAMVSEQVATQTARARRAVKQASDEVTEAAKPVVRAARKTTRAAARAVAEVAEQVEAAV